MQSSNTQLAVAARAQAALAAEYGKSTTVATHAGPQSQKQRYESIWGDGVPSVTTNGNK